jgi:hypothetical protein
MNSVATADLVAARALASALHKAGYRSTEVQGLDPLLWDLAASIAGLEDPVVSGTRRAVQVILADREKHPDAFDQLPGAVS